MSARALTFFIVRRLAALVVLLVIISFGVFTLLYLAPGSVEDILRGTRPSTPETTRAIREQYHLNDSFLMQYWIWAKDAAQLNFGSSIRTSEPVLDGIRSRASLSAYLGIYAFAIVMLLGVPLGALAAVRKRSPVDRGIVGLGVVGVSAPAFATGIFLLYLFAVRLSWFPAYGQGSGFANRIWHLTLPAVALALTGMALVIKLTRAAMINALDQDYVVFARARGIPRRRVLVTYAFRNALVPVVTAAGLILGYLLTGAVLVEVTFALPGVGALLVDSVTFKDVPMVQGVALLVAAVIILINLLTDILYLFVDPRVRFGRGAS
ncbi:MAG: peptide/nickel transport system permease protein [Gaiellales bacterium]|nr:peptide/nickel transport system permease protein [Gaiellales bacterium]